MVVQQDSSRRERVSRQGTRCSGTELAELTSRHDLRRPQQCVEVQCKLGDPLLLDPRLIVEEEGLLGHGEAHAEWSTHLLVQPQEGRVPLLRRAYQPPRLVALRHARLPRRPKPVCVATGEQRVNALPCLGFPCLRFRIGVAMTTGLERSSELRRCERLPRCCGDKDEEDEGDG